MVIRARRVVPRKAHELGYTFQYPHTAEALHDLLGEKSRSLTLTLARFSVKLHGMPSIGTPVIGVPIRVMEGERADEQTS